MERRKPRRDAPSLLLEHLPNLGLFLLLRLRALREGRAAARIVALGSQQLAERIVRTGIGGIQADRLAERLLRASRVAFLFQSGAQHEPRLAILRLNRER